MTDSIAYYCREIVAFAVAAGLVLLGGIVLIAALAAIGGGLAALDECWKKASRTTKRKFYLGLLIAYAALALLVWSGIL